MFELEFIRIKVLSIITWRASHHLVHVSLNIFHIWVHLIPLSLDFPANCALDSLRFVSTRNGKKWTLKRSLTRSLRPYSSYVCSVLRNKTCMLSICDYFSSLFTQCRRWPFFSLCSLEEQQAAATWKIALFLRPLQASIPLFATLALMSCLRSWFAAALSLPDIRFSNWGPVTEIESLTHDFQAVICAPDLLEQKNIVFSNQLSIHQRMIFFVYY